MIAGLFQKNMTFYMYNMIFYKLFSIQLRNYNKFFLQFLMLKKPQMSFENCYLSFYENSELHPCKLQLFQDKSIKIYKNSSPIINSQINKNPKLVENIPSFNLEINLTLKFTASIQDFYVTALNINMMEILLKNRDKNEQLRFYMNKNSQNYQKIYQFFKLSCFIQGFNQYFSLGRIEKYIQKEDYFIVQQKISKADRMVKKFSKTEFNKNFEDEAFKEINLQRKVKCKNIMSHYGYFEDQANFYLIFQQIPLKTLRQFVIQSRRVEVAYTKLIMKQILEALLQLQIKGVLHNNIRMSTIKLIKNEQNSQLRFCLDDFSECASLSQLKKSGQTVTKFFGYSAPEVINEKIGIISHKSDIFMLGVVFYQLLINKPPFDMKLLNAKPDMLDNYPKINFDSHQLNKISFQAKELLNRMLDFNVDKRISVIDALTHRYFTIPESLIIKEIQKQNVTGEFQTSPKIRYLDQKKRLKYGYKLQQNQKYQLVQCKTLQVARTSNQKENVETIYQTIGGRAQQKRNRIKLGQLKRKKRTLVLRENFEGDIDPSQIDDSHIDLEPKSISIMKPSYQSKKEIC